jgi:competence protein CoiA
MFYAIVNGHKVSATPAASGLCPGCDAQMIAKCGDIKRWHWAHVAGRDCDPWHEGETDWHLEWKSLFPAQDVEVCLGEHRADVRSGSTIIEFQNSPISQAEIAEREEFYGRSHQLIWVFNARGWSINLRCRKTAPQICAEWLGTPTIQSEIDRDITKASPYRSFRWRWPHQSLAAVSARMFWDFDGRFFYDDIGAGLLLLEVEKIHWNGNVGGWGYLRSKQEFMNQVLAQSHPIEHHRSLF